MKWLNGQADFLATAQNMVELCSGMGSSLPIAQIETTDALGISRKSLWEKIRKHKVKR
jgi:biotin operon repressor